MDLTEISYVDVHRIVQVLQESLSIPGTDIYLVYRSSQTSGYMSTILIQLTADDVPQDLVVVHLRIIVEGLVYERMFEADPHLRYRFTWDRRNAYNQKVYGIVTANGRLVVMSLLSTVYGSELSRNKFIRLVKQYKVENSYITTKTSMP